MERKLEAMKGSLQEGWCAPACIAHVAQQLSFDPDQRQFAAIMGFSEEYGVDGLQSQIGLAAMGLASCWLQTSVNKLIYLKENFECFVMVNWMASDTADLKYVDDNHYSLFETADHNTVTLNDPLFGGAIITLYRAFFERHWHEIPESDDFSDIKPRHRNWALVITKNQSELDRIRELALII